MYVPELVFGHLLTSSNYNDKEKKTTGGWNGYGAKLANIFSKSFVIETADSTHWKRFKQSFTNNMTKRTEPKIEDFEETALDFTIVTFEPDFSRFDIKKLTDDMLSLMYRWVYDIAGISPKTTNVYLNKKKLEVKDFSSYVDLYLSNLSKSEESLLEKYYDEYPPWWQIAVAASDGEFQ